MRSTVLTFWSLRAALRLCSAAVGTPASLKEEADWRAEREAKLRRSRMAGYRLPGCSGCMTAPWRSGRIRNPMSCCPRARRAVQERCGCRSGVVTFEPAEGRQRHPVDGKPAEKDALKPDTDPTSRCGSGRHSLTLTIIKRMDRTGVRMRDPDAATRRNFTGCKWFPACREVARESEMGALSGAEEDQNHQYSRDDG